MREKSVSWTQLQPQPITKIRLPEWLAQVTFRTKMIIRRYLALSRIGIHRIRKRAKRPLMKTAPSLMPFKRSLLQANSFKAQTVTLELSKIAQSLTKSPQVKGLKFKKSTVRIVYNYYVQPQSNHQRSWTKQSKNCWKPMQQASRANLKSSMKAVELSKVKTSRSC